MKGDDPRSEQLDRIVAECLAVRVRLINRVVSGLYDEALRPFGLGVGQANLLITVARLGEARPAAVARTLRLEKSTLSRDVEVLKRRGWLESDPPEGGRNQTLRVTRRGLVLLERSAPAWESAQAEATRLIGEPGVESLRAIAERLGFGRQAE